MRIPQSMLLLCKQGCNYTDMVMVASDISGIGISILRKKIKPKILKEPIIDSDSSMSKVFDQTLQKIVIFEKQPLPEEK